MTARVLRAVAWVSLLASTEAAAGEFMDVRLSWVLAENNFLAEPGETLVNSPGLGIGADESDTLFFDNYETKYTGFETFGHLVLSKQTPAFFEDFYAEASLFVRIGQDLHDEGSFIRLSYDLSGGRSSDENIELTLFPLSGDRFRLGYSYDISWGGDGVFPNKQGFAPAVKLQVNLPWAYGFLGFKTARLQEHIGDTEQTGMVTNYGVLAGGGIDISGIRAEVCGGYFSRGTFAHQGVRGRNSYAGGVSYQLGYHRGRPIGSSIDFQLYRDDPYMEQRFFLPEEYDGGVSLVVKHEGTIALQRLMDPEAYGRVVTQPAYAFDLNFKIKAGFLRVHLDAVLQSLSYVLFDEPSFTPYQTFPDAASSRPEIWAALGVDYHFEGPRLTPGIKVGVLRPATYTMENLDVGNVTFTGTRTVIVRDPQFRSVLPPDTKELPVWSVKASLKWDYAEMLALVAEVYYTRDSNLVRYDSDFSGLNVISVFADPDIIGLNLMAQARY